MIDIITWVIMWIVVWGIFLLFLKKRNITYLQNYLYLSGYFLAASLLAIFMFKDQVFFLLHYFSVTPFVVLFLFLLGILLSYHYVKKNWKDHMERLRENPNFLFSLDKRYFISKTTDIIFQQIMISVLVVLFLEFGLNLSEIIILFAVLFGIVHVPLIKIQGLFWGSYFSVFSILSAIVFPALIVKIQYGFMYTFLIHWLFYIISGTFFSLKTQKAHDLPKPLIS